MQDESLLRTALWEKLKWVTGVLNVCEEKEGKKEVKKDGEEIKWKDTTNLTSAEESRGNRPETAVLWKTCLQDWSLAGI